MDREPNGRGVLRPDRLPDLVRLPPGPGESHLVRWYWISRWNLPPGEHARQDLIAFPAFNLVVTDHGVLLSGPTTRISHRDLHGRGFGVGALLWPAATPLLTGDAASCVDRVTDFAAPELLDGVRRADPASSPHAGAAAVADWLCQGTPEPDPEALLANRVIAAVEAPQPPPDVAALAERVGVAVRTLQRLTRRYIGLSPLTLLQRRRIQEAADRVRSAETRSLADIAVDLGYTDHAHLSREFRKVLGVSPSEYREVLRRDADDPPANTKGVPGAECSGR
ncbi:helix-turn-helix domain-containing protein [Gordonia caeni]|uniref:Helix-turn-helix domain-containing protein n=1 Tax=Gordonia caeni TaxID=1007097 RepID=A0ABP7PDA4_9ACTN